MNIKHVLSILLVASVPLHADLDPSFVAIGVVSGCIGLSTGFLRLTYMGRIVTTRTKLSNYMPHDH